MAKVDLVMPKMGESIIEATILKWLKKVGDTVEIDEPILEIATDKVDSEIPSPVKGVIAEILFEEESVVEIGTAIAIIATEGTTVETAGSSAPAVEEAAKKIMEDIPASSAISNSPQSVQTDLSAQVSGDDNRFYSPLVKSIAKAENISSSELSVIPGTGAGNRVTKKDILAYVANRTTSGTTTQATATPVANAPVVQKSAAANVVQASSVNGNVEIIEMDRMRRIIADHMVMSKHTSPHVTSFVEADVTNLVRWREANKNKFHSLYGTKITYTPLFIDAVVRAIKDFPLVNVSVDGSNILVKKDINIGMATALPSGNLIVPVIRNADMLSLAGIATSVNDLAGRARENKLKPTEIQDGTFTITNVGTFGNLMGTPIINQPQVAILSTGAIVKKPVVLETENGDVIAIRQMMFLSLSYDHRVVDGMLGGSFLKRIADNLSNFDVNTKV